MATTSAPRTADEVGRQLWDATTRQRALQAELDALRAAADERRLDEMCERIETDPDPRAVLGMIEELLWVVDRGSIARLVNTYFVATDPKG